MSKETPLDVKDIERVNVGMTRVQVRALLGTPMIADPFHQERWDYYFYLKMGRWEHPMRRHFIVHFDADDKVARIEKRGPDINKDIPVDADGQRDAQRAAEGKLEESEES